MRIGELGQAAGVDVATIRYYERIGLLPPPGRLANGYRRYTTEHQERLAFIRSCRLLDLPLADIRCLLDCRASPDQDCGQVDALIEAQLARVRERIAQLCALETQLQALRGRCAMPRTVADCGILHGLEPTSTAPGDAPPPAAG